MVELDHIAPEQLSAFHDGELSPAERAGVAAHLERCEGCLSRLDEIERVGRIAATLPVPVPGRDLWPNIEAAIPERSMPWTNPGALFRRPAATFAAAATLIVVLVGGLVLFGPLQDRFETTTETAGLLGFDYGAFLAGLNEPAKMKHFDRAYDRRKLSLEEALSEAHVTVDDKLLEQIPEGLDLAAVYILSNKNARALQVTYRHNSNEIAVFKQPEGLPVRFAGYRIEPAAIGSKQCLMVDTGRFCAITFSSDEAQYVVIGRNDDMEVAQVIDNLLASL